MKLPPITQQPVGEYALGNIATPNAAQVGEAFSASLKGIGRVASVVYNQQVVGDFDEATGEAAKEITDLRGRLVNENTIPLDAVPEDIETEFEVTVSDGTGGRNTVSAPTVFTHQVADKMWNKGTEEIISHYASTIESPEARAKFIEEMQTRYVIPGTLAVASANSIRSKAYGQARAERAVEGVLSSEAPSKIREEEARDIIERQMLIGADPVWVEKQLAALGPMIDQMDVHNDILGAGAVDEIDQIEEDMWTDGNRMSPEQMRTMSTQMDARRRDFKAERISAQTENADEMFVAFVDDDLTNQDIADAVGQDNITREAAWTLYNAMNKGSTTKASSPFTLSRLRGEIFKLQYTGGEGNLRVTEKAKLLKLMVSRGAMGLTPEGVPTGVPATISGQDAFQVNKDIDAAVKLALENEAYKNTFQNVLLWTNSKLDFGGQLTAQFDGNQFQVEAAVAFKNALNNYMDTYGIDAKPAEFFEANKDAYNPNKFSRGANGAFLKQVPAAEPFINKVSESEFEFDPTAQENFIEWLAENQAVLGAERYTQISSLFDQYYRGKGIAPDNGALMLEPEDPLYNQFQQMIPDYE